jgi:hypothetical protein
LVENVLNKGFNPGEFATFLNAQKENGGMVEMWTLEELKATVENYTTNHNLDGQPIGPQYNHEEEYADIPGTEVPYDIN